jgi:hypothetical protein
MAIRCADHATPSITKKLALTLPKSGGRSVGIVRLRTKAMEFSFFNGVGSGLVTGSFAVQGVLATM